MQTRPYPWLLSLLTGLVLVGAAVGTGCFNNAIPVRSRESGICPENKRTDQEDESERCDRFLKEFAGPL